MEAAELTEARSDGDDRSAFAGVLRYYELAKRAEWQVRDLPWGEVPPIPEYTGTPQKLARRRDMWRSVVTQQLQADELAVEMAAQLFATAPDPEAKLYYTTMVQDESRHTEAWLKLADGHLAPGHVQGLGHAIGGVRRPMRHFLERHPATLQEFIEVHGVPPEVMEKRAAAKVKVYR